MKKNKFAFKLCIALILLFLCIGTISAAVILDNTGPDESTEISGATSISVQNGIATPDMEESPLEVSEEGKYHFTITHKTAPEGLLTGIVIKDANQNAIYAMTASNATVETHKFRLSAGSYTVEYHYLPTQDSYDAFLEEYKLMLEDSDNMPEETENGNTYRFKDSGTYKIYTSYKLEKFHPLMYALGMVCGILSGVLVAFLIFFLLRLLIRKTGGKIDFSCSSKSYDERQTLARGQAYKIAFFTLSAYIFALGIWDEIFGDCILLSLTGLLLGFCFSLTVFAVICIIKDAYMSLYENTRGILITFPVIIALNIVVNLNALMQHQPFLENNAISLKYVNLLLAAMLTIILIVFVLKLLYNRSREKDMDV